MKRIPIPVVLLILFPGPAGAGQQAVPHRGQGYVFWGPGGANNEAAIQHLGAGGEVCLWKGLGVGAEIGYLSPMRSLGDGAGVLSVNGLYDFGRTRQLRLSPFVTGGYSLAFGGGVANAVNVGGGLHLWLGRRAGLRFELRDHFVPTYSRVHVWEARVGLDFR